MLFSMALILLTGMLAGYICRKVRLPALTGMVLTGIILGPGVLNLIDSSILGISSELRRAALIIILIRAGLTLDIKDLKRTGRPAVLMCFVPAAFEIAAMVIFAPKLLGLTMAEAAVLGAVTAAVSPAVIVPEMIRLIEGGWGIGKSIPQMILAGASVDDVFVIVMFTVFTQAARGQQVSPLQILNIPISIVLGAAAGLLTGLLLSILFEKFHIRDTAKIMIILSVSFLLSAAQNAITGAISFSALIAVMCTGMVLQKRREEASKRLAVRFNKLWVFTEIILFVLVGAAVDISYVGKTGAAAVVLIAAGLLFRTIGVVLCLVKTGLNLKERLFCVFAYLPKATVQAAIGGVPLAMGMACGNTVLSVAVLAILITAPLGAFLMDMSYKKLLVREDYKKSSDYMKEK